MGLLPNTGDNSVSIHTTLWSTLLFVSRSASSRFLQTGHQDIANTKTPDDFGET